MRIRNHNTVRRNTTIVRVFTIVVLRRKVSCQWLEGLHFYWLIVRPLFLTGSMIPPYLPGQQTSVNSWQQTSVAASKHLLLAGGGLYFCLPANPFFWLEVTSYYWLAANTITGWQQTDISGKLIPTTVLAVSKPLLLVGCNHLYYSTY